MTEQDAATLRELVRDLPMDEAADFIASVTKLPPFEARDEAMRIKEGRV